MSCYFPLGTMLWVLFILPHFMFHMACACPVEERAALLHFRSLMVEANTTVGVDILSSWGRSDDCCSWERVTCNNSTRQVSGLNLHNMSSLNSAIGGTPACSRLLNLNLTIFSSFHALELLDLFWNSACLQNFDGLQELTKLRYLNLSVNYLIGDNVLESLGRMGSLEAINFRATGVGGALQNIDFRNLKNLRELRLAYNQLNGSIPASLFELPRLEYLDLSGNLLQGHIPISLPLNISLPLKTLKLAGNNLNGKFDFFWLQNYAMLKEVDLSWNTELAIDVKFLTSVTPFQLRALILSGCNLDNSIISGPNLFATQRHVQLLELSNNNLVGSLPNWVFSNGTALIYLGLANNLLEGSLDLMWQQQSNLEMINISMNFFTGQLPVDISTVFPYLGVLEASYNNISGHLPSSLCNISNLEFVDLSNNKITGEVPSCLFTDCSLDILKLSNNNLGGPIIGGANNYVLNIIDIYLDNNYFEGSLPNNISGYVRVMDFHHNKLSGELDLSFWNISSCVSLSVASNNLSGQLYPTICNMIHLGYLDISDNNFHGSMPNCSTQLPLYFLNMSSNTLSGFPSYFFNSSSVIALDLSDNQFEGSLDWIRHLSRIKFLQLGANMFEGNISTDLCHLRYLNIIDLSHNRLSGSVPSCIGGISFGYQTNEDYVFWSTFEDFCFFVGQINMDNDKPQVHYATNSFHQGFTFSTKGNAYTYSRGFFNLMSGIDLSANKLSGEIPWEIGNLSHVKSLNLSHNFFTGQIPDTIANMSAVESLDLSHNKLSGPIPWQMTQMSSLEVFSVAYNNLSGCIPNLGQFSSFSGESYLGNTNLHNLSLGNKCSLAAGPVEAEDVDDASEDSVLYIISVASFVLAFWATVAFVFCHSLGQRVVLQL